uniref:Protein PIN-LIKES 7-like n=1 Tax=Tanacetum cinerariifolium TaxID=118510 RepID=A0A699HMV0_TANCI|nr:protein PIN-LIKES 7-like [Tanacetum cinerariifolium]
MENLGNYANLLVIMVPAMCTDDSSPFGDHSVCKARGLSYASFSMALGSFYTWTCTYQMMQVSALRYNAMKKIEKLSNEENKDLDANQNTGPLNKEDHDHIDRIVPLSNLTNDDTENQCIEYQELSGNEEKKELFAHQLIEILKKIMEQLLSPPTLGSFAGLVFGAIPWVKRLLIGETAPLRVVQDSMILLGDGTIPCLTLILGGNLTQGLRKRSVGPMIIIAVIIVRYLILPIIGIGVIKMAATLGLLPADPLFSFVLLIMFALPPGVNISTMAQLFNVGQEECAMLMMWTYLASAFSLTAWSTLYMWILS